MPTTQRFALVMLVCAACTGQTLDVGTNDAGTPATASDASTESATTTPPPGDSGAPPGSVLAGGTASALLGTWTGYVESYSFASGSDNLAFTFTRDTSGDVEGAVVFGQGQAPPPASDPTLGYPPSAEGDYATASPVGSQPDEGFAYTALAMSFDGTRLKMGVVEQELWKGWCPLQTPYGTELDGGGPPYSCAPNWGIGPSSSGGCMQTNPVTHAVVPIDCLRYNLCTLGSICVCTATACAVDMTVAPEITFDTQLASDHLDGSTVLSGQVHNVHFTRSP